MTDTILTGEVTDVIDERDVMFKAPEAPLRQTRYDIAYIIKRL